MKKTKKRVLGLLGLVLVAVTTIFAVFLPGPEASATETGSITDKIVVRVVGNQPKVTIMDIKNGDNIVKPDLSFTFDYENVEYASVYIDYTDAEGNTVRHDLVTDFFANYGVGPYEPPITLDLLSEGYGYGHYLITVKGVGFDGVTDTDLVEFYFYPVTGEVEEDDNDGLTYLHLNYDTNNEKIHTIKINIYDENGDLVGSMSPITVAVPGTKVELPFAENNMSDGNYKIAISAYDSMGNLLYGKPYTLYYEYKTLPVPDTGGLFTNLNISHADYLATGLLIFLSAAVLGTVFVTRGKGRKNRLGKKRR